MALDVYLPPAEVASVLIAERTIAAAVQTVDITVPGANYTFIEIMAFINNSAVSNSNYGLRLNAATTSIEYKRLIAQGAAVSTDDQSGTTAGTVLTTAWGSMRFKIASKFLNMRTGDWECATAKADGTFSGTTGFTLRGHLAFASSAAITSIGIGASVASSIGIGSVIKVYGWR